MYKQPRIISQQIWGLPYQLWKILHHQASRNQRRYRNKSLRKSEKLWKYCIYFDCARRWQTINHLHHWEWKLISPGYRRDDTAYCRRNGMPPYTEDARMVSRALGNNTYQQSQNAIRSLHNNYVIAWWNAPRTRLASYNVVWSSTPIAALKWVLRVLCCSQSRSSVLIRARNSHLLFKKSDYKINLVLVHSLTLVTKVHAITATSHSNFAPLWT